MDRDLQKEILEIIAGDMGSSDFSHFRAILIAKYAKKEGFELRAFNTKVKKCVDSLEIEKKILSSKEHQNDEYFITPEGLRVLEPWYKKTWYFLIFDKHHNLIALIALFVSVIAIIRSW